MIDIDAYFDRYLESEGLRPGRVEAIGKIYRENGHLNRDQVQALAHECSMQSARYAQNNSISDCLKATHDVRRLRYDASKVSVLCGLNGISVPTASFILTALDPLDHGIVTQQVQTSLRYLGYIDATSDRLTAADYTTIIRHIRSIAREENCTAAAVSYALAEHGRDVQERDQDTLLQADSTVPADIDPSTAPVTA